MSGFLGIKKIGSLLAEADEPIDWIVENMIPRGGVTFLVARPGAGKTLLAYHIAACVIFGTPLFGEITVTSGAVAYVDLDMHRKGIAAMRAVAAMRGIGSDDEEITAAPLHIAADLASIDIRDKSVLRSILDDLQQIDNLALAIFDTFSDLHHGKEQSPDDMTDTMAGAVAIATECKCGVLVIHHLRKNGGNDLEDVRGASSITAKADAVFMLKPEREDDQNPGSLTLLQRKARLTEEAKSRTIALDAEGEPGGKMTRYTYVTIGAASVGGRPPTVATKAAAIIDREMSKNPAITKGELAKALIANDIAKTTAYNLAGKGLSQNPDNPPLAEVLGNGARPAMQGETDSQDGHDADIVGNVEDADLAMMNAWDVLINWAIESSSPFSDAELDAAQIAGFESAEGEGLTDTVRRVYEEHRRWRAAT